MAKGTKVEKEHTPDPAKAKEIAKDHLEEHSRYYSELKKMEDKLEREKTAQPDRVDQMFSGILRNLGEAFLK